MRKATRIPFILGCIFLLFLTACNTDYVEEKQEIEDVKELVHDYSVGEFTDLSASITSNELIVIDQNNDKTIYELPKDEFFVSIAPYLDVTHDCAIHSLTGCQGELVEQEFEVIIHDEEGNIMVDQEMQSFKNGFIDLWLPRNQTFNVQIKYEDKIAETEISTFDGDHTCITTMQLT